MRYSMKSLLEQCEILSKHSGLTIKARKWNGIIIEINEHQMPMRADTPIMAHKMIHMYLMGYNEAKRHMAEGVAKALKEGREQASKEFIDRHVEEVHKRALAKHARLELEQLQEAKDVVDTMIH